MLWNCFTYFCRFYGVPFRSTVQLFPTTNCLISLAESVSLFLNGWVGLWSCNTAIIYLVSSKFLTDSKTQRMYTYLIKFVLACYSILYGAPCMWGPTLVIASCVNLYIYCLNVATLYCHSGRSGTGAL